VEVEVALEVLDNLLLLVKVESVEGTAVEGKVVVLAEQKSESRATLSAVLVLNVNWRKCPQSPSLVLCQSSRIERSFQLENCYCYRCHHSGSIGCLYSC
jgi:hypothetical protein